MIDDIKYAVGEVRILSDGIDSMVSFVAYILATKLMERLEIYSDVTIEFNSEWADANEVRGATNETEDGSYHIILDPNDDNIDLVLCHEFVHIWQMEYEAVRYIEEDEDSYFIWKGERIDNPIHPPQWEVEADELESVLYDELQAPTPV